MAGENKQTDRLIYDRLASAILSSAKPSDMVVTPGRQFVSIIEGLKKGSAP